MKRSFQAVVLFFAGLITLFWFGPLPKNSNYGDLSTLIIPYILMCAGIYIARKKLVRIIMLFALVFISLSLTAIFYMEEGENPYSYYPTFQSAINDGATGEGRWIPKMIPSSATEIHEQHNLDINTVWLRFNLPSTEKVKIISGLRKMSNQEIEQINLRYPWRADDWWFEGLIQQQPTNDNALNAEIYWADGLGNSFLAFDCCSSRVYYWIAY